MGRGNAQISVGEVVIWIPDSVLRSEAHGDYRIVAAMPDQTAITCTGLKVLLKNTNAS